MSFAFIAPYEAMRAEAETIIAAEKLPGVALLGRGMGGVAAAREAMKNGAKILVSRGGTARMIAEELHQEVVEVKISVPSIAGFLHEKTERGTKLIIAGSRQIIDIAEPLCAAMGRAWISYDVENITDVDKFTDEVRAWGPAAAIADAAMVRFLEPAGFPVHLVESTPETIREAFSQAMQILVTLRRIERGRKNVTSVLNCMPEGAILVGAEGRIEEINRQGCQLLGVSRDDALGSDYRTLIPGGEVAAAVGSQRNMQNHVMFLGADRFVCNVSTVNRDSGGDSSVITFQHIEQIQRTEVSTRKKIYQKGLFARYNFDDILHNCDAMRQAIAVAKEYSASSSNILIQGESGTGKELFAQSIHNASPLSREPFVAVNCAALPASLLESELFGYVGGAFTGARPEGKAGLFEMAHQGTLFLDEIGEMDVSLQARLLRAIQEREIMRLGGDNVIPVKVRVISATNRQLSEAVRSGRFRSDLFFRLNVLDLTIPPLRERGNDASFLFRALLRKRFGREGELPTPSASFMQSLDKAYWPGNIRQLENLVEKYITLGGKVDALPDDSGPPESARPTAPALPSSGGSLDSVIAAYTRQVLTEEGGNIAHAAARLGISKNTVKRWRDWTP
ncbi:MAG: sigma 54-interacting transcriptional regulator [Planctomycetaceae bacterium]|nr:sigma 54-interacting transcriptional regulator [Planctomycetaceae bacterium]